MATSKRKRRKFKTSKAKKTTPTTHKFKAKKKGSRTFLQKKLTARKNSTPDVKESSINLLEMFMDEDITILTTSRPKQGYRKKREDFSSSVVPMQIYSAAGHHLGNIIEYINKTTHMSPTIVQAIDFATGTFMDMSYALEAIRKHRAIIKIETMRPAVPKIIAISVSPTAYEVIKLLSVKGKCPRYTVLDIILRTVGTLCAAAHPNIKDSIITPSRTIRFKYAFKGMIQANARQLLAHYRKTLVTIQKTPKIL